MSAGIRSGGRRGNGRKRSRSRRRFNSPSFAGTNFGCTDYGKREGGRGLQILHEGRKNWEDVKVFPEKRFWPNIHTRNLDPYARCTRKIIFLIPIFKFEFPPLSPLVPRLLPCGRSVVVAHLQVAICILASAWEWGGQKRFFFFFGIICMNMAGISIPASTTCRRHEGMPDEKNFLGGIWFDKHGAYKDFFHIFLGYTV